MTDLLWHSIINSEFRNACMKETELKKAAICNIEASLEGKTILITGGNTGIGKECARDFVKRGARKVIIACRNVKKGEFAKEEIENNLSVNDIIQVKYLDLSDFNNVRIFAEEIKKSENQLHILLNNAGIFLPIERYTKDGNEMLMATNHLGHFLLTMLLIDLLKSSAPSRIVNVTSAIHFVATDLMLNDFNLKNKWFFPTGGYLYGRSKLANVIFSKELNKRYSSFGVTSYSCHPGYVDTEISRNVSFWNSPGQFIIMPLVSLFSSIKQKTPFEGAQTSIYCCVCPGLEVNGGSYFSECEKKEYAKIANNDDLCNELWKISSELVKL